MVVHAGVLQIQVLFGSSVNDDFELQDPVSDNNS